MILIMMLLRKMQRKYSDKHRSVCLPLSYIFLHDSWYLSNHIGLIALMSLKMMHLEIYHLRSAAQITTVFSLMAGFKPNKYTRIRAAFFGWIFIFAQLFKLGKERIL